MSEPVFPHQLTLPSRVWIILGLNAALWAFLIALYLGAQAAILALV